MRVFLDTNVLVSAFVGRGLCTDLLRIVVGEHELLVSSLVAEEVERVLRDKLRAPKTVVDRALSIFDEVEFVPDSTAVPGGSDLDEDDATILASAIEAEADVFVTGDQELLAVAKRSPIPAVSPRKFMELLRVPGDSYASPPGGDDEPRVSEQMPVTVGEMAFEFALSISKLTKTLEEGREGVLARELLRAAANIGANLEEVGTAASRRDFDRRMAGALRQAHETKYWLRLLAELKIAPAADFATYLDTCLELIRLLAAGRPFSQ